MSDERVQTPSGREPRWQKYQAVMELGRGGMGVVHLAMSRGPQGFLKLVVLKMLKSQLLGDHSAHQMFLEEARISARLSHPNLVQVYEVIEYDGLPTMVMEYLEGQPLSALHGDSAEHVLPLHLQLHVITKVLSGLHACHELKDYGGKPLNLVHRDVSPHNIFVLYDGQVKVLDFGIAKSTSSTIETQTGELKGKIRYMAPEQLMGTALDRRVDIFASGVMLAEAVIGKRFWGDMPEGEVMLALLTKKVPLSFNGSKVPEELERICRKALEGDPGNRYPTAAAFQHDLERYLAHQQEPCTADDLSAFLAQHFQVAREARNALISAQLTLAESFQGEPTSIRGMSEDRETLVQHTPSRTTTLQKQALTQATNQLAPVGKRRRIAQAVGGGILFVSLLAGGLLARSAFQNKAGSSPVLGNPTVPAPAHCSADQKLCGAECVSKDRPDRGCGSDSCLVCTVPNATSRCNVKHDCDIAICYRDFDNCDGNPLNGCEANIRIDPDNCGGCGRKCPELPHAQRGCGDVCTIWKCESGYGDCNRDGLDGCEVRTADDSKNCGRCGNACNAGQVCRHGKCTR